MYYISIRHIFTRHNNNELSYITHFNLLYLSAISDQNVFGITTEDSLYIFYIFISMRFAGISILIFFSITCLPQNNIN